MNFVLLVTALGPLLGATGWFLHMSFLFWLGVAVCALTLFLNMASGAMKLPVLPVAFMVFFAGVVSPWWLGVGAGLVAWTALETIGESLARLRRTK